MSFRWLQESSGDTYFLFAEVDKFVSNLFEMVWEMVIVNTPAQIDGGRDFPI